MINGKNGYWWLMAALVAVSLMVGACSHEAPTVQLSAEDRFALGVKKFQDEDYLGAIEEFKVITLQFQGTSVADKAQFYMAECRFRREEYILAAYEYDMLIRTMSTSELVGKARFQRATCFYELSPKYYLDQDYSRKAIDEYQAFLEYFPTDSLAPVAESRIGELNTKLAHKEFNNGMTYLKLEYYKAATYYFDLVLEKYHDTPYAEPSLLRKAEALRYRKRFSDAKQELAKFLARYPSSTLRPEAEALDKDIDAEMESARLTAQKKLSEHSSSVPATVPRN